MLTLDDESQPPSQPVVFPSLQPADLEQVAQTILQLFNPQTSGNPELAKQLQSELHRIQSTPEAWGLIAGLASHDDPNVRFFSAHTAQVKISRDWESLPEQLHTSLLSLLLTTLSNAISSANPQSYQPANAVVVRKLFTCLASLLLRLPFPHFPRPITTVLQTISSSGDGSGAQGSTDVGMGDVGTSLGGYLVGHRLRLWSLEWCAICVEEMGRAELSDVKRNAVRKHIEAELPAVMSTLTSAMSPPDPMEGSDQLRAKLKEAEAACRCAEAWVFYGLGADELTTLLPHLYGLLPMPAASATLVEVLSESIFKYGKGAKVLTEPLLAWIIGPSGQSVIGSADGEPSEETLGVGKLIAALIEHSSDWLVSRIEHPDVQALLGVVLRLTAWKGTGNVDEHMSELTLPIYPLIQEAIMDSDAFSAPYDSAPTWGVARQFFRELVSTIRTKVRWPGMGESTDGLGGLDKDDREAFDSWRRDAGEVVICAYYILREEMLSTLVELARVQVESTATWQDIEATLHCIRYSSEAVPLGEARYLPIVFSDAILGQLANRPMVGRGEERLRLTVVCLIQAYEEWFKFHPDHLLPILSYLVPSLTSTRIISRSAADSLKTVCDICRNKLVQHIGAFSELHGKLGELGPEEQIKVVQAITSVIQALAPPDAVGPVEGILTPICDQVENAIRASQTDATAAQPLLVHALHALTACFKGLTPSDDDIFDLTDDDELEQKEIAVKRLRMDQRMFGLRLRIEQVVEGAVQVWNGDGEIADALSSLVKHSTLSSSETLISLSPLPLITLVTTACERSPSALWISLAGTLVMRVNSPPSALTVKKDKTVEEQVLYEMEEQERWNVVAGAATRLLSVASNIVGVPGGVAEHPDVAEAWYNFSSNLSSRFPGILLRLPSTIVETYVSLGIMGLSAQERFSLKASCDFLVALLSTTRFPSPLEPISDALLQHFGPQMLRAILLSAGAEGPRSVIPNLAELLATFVTRIKGEALGVWLDQILGEPGFPDVRATNEAKIKLKQTVLRYVFVSSTLAFSPLRLISLLTFLSVLIWYS
ncbi:hypothetical protein M231_03134 [Tremella mesenterica]|uniref:Importin N-terminal domain-containing protein n=1 Tax=Tremella mesenterica TaxID=5217 RepID=A0A4Q1BPD1_TREME|nr:hypothetical protein M231_03134 [Tremella mesenterica]